MSEAGEVMREVVECRLRGDRPRMFEAAAGLDNDDADAFIAGSIEAFASFAGEGGHSASGTPR